MDHDENIAESAYKRVKKHSKPGSGARFKALEHALAVKGARSPGGLAAYIGRRDYGKARFQNMASAGKKG